MWQTTSCGSCGTLFDGALCLWAVDVYPCDSGCLSSYNAKHIRLTQWSSRVASGLNAELTHSALPVLCTRLGAYMPMPSS